MHAKRSNIRSSFARHPENAEIALFIEFDKFRLVDCANAKLALDGRNERGTLEKRTSKGLKGTGKRSGVGETIMETKNANVFLAYKNLAESRSMMVRPTCSLLRLDKTGCTVDAHNQASGNLRVESSTVSSLLDTEYPSEPGDNFVRRGIGRFFKINYTRSNNRSRSDTKTGGTAYLM